MKRLIFTYILFALLLSACGGSQSTPTATTAPVNTPTPIPTITQTSSPTPIPPPPVISASNVMNLQEEFRIGKGTVSDIIWTPDEKIILSYSTGVSVHNLLGKEIKSTQPQNKAVSTDSAISLDGKYVASLIDYKKVLIWDANDGTIKFEFDTNCQSIPYDRGHKVAFSYDLSKIAACDEGGVSIWDTSSGEKLNTFQIANSFPSIIMFSPLNNVMIVSSTREPDQRDSLVDLEILDLISGQVLKTFTFRSSPAFALNHTGNILALTQTGTDLTLFDINDKKVLKTITPEFKGAYPGRIVALDFSQDDKTIAVGSNYYSGTFLVDVESGKVVSSPNNNAANFIKFSPTDNYYFAGWDGFAVYRYSANQNLMSINQVGNLGNFRSYTTIAFNPKGRYMAVGSSPVMVWDFKKNAALSNIEPWGWLFAFTPDGNKIITNMWNDRDWNHKIAVWDLRNSQQHSVEDITEPKDNFWITPPKISPSGNYAALGIGRKYIRLVDLNSYNLSFKLNSYFSDFEFSPNGKVLAVSGSNITLWDYNTGEKIQTIINTLAGDITFSLDGTLLAGIVWRQGVLVWKADTGELIHQFKDIRGSSLLSFSPQGDVLVSLGYDDGHATLFAWDLADEKLLYNIVGTKEFQYPDSVFDSRAQFQFSPDGSLIATKGFGDYIEFIDATSGKTLNVLNNIKVTFVNENDSYSFAFSADGRRFAVAGADGIIRILIVQP